MAPPPQSAGRINHFDITAAKHKDATIAERRLPSDVLRVRNDFDASNAIDPMSSGAIGARCGIASVAVSPHDDGTQMRTGSAATRARATALGDAMTSLDQDGKIFVGKSDKPETLTLAFGNRHGLITGATGTGKTVTLQALAEGFSRAGVPVFAADVKGDLSGIAAHGEMKEAFIKRAAGMGFDYAPEQFPVVFWDLFGEQGHPIRATIHDMGPLLLTRMLDLNDVQEGVINIAFRVVREAGAADDPDKGLVDLENLRELLAHVSAHAKTIGARYGNVAGSTIGAVQRELLVIENQGGDKFFGTPEFDLGDLMATDADGRGRIGVLAADKLMESPRLYATFLLWLIAELFDQLPEVGDLDKPKLVFFFDEAHLLFDEAPKALIDKIEQVVRLIRSKGVGIYFVTQSPLDVPDEVLAQLGNRVQHALRAFTPRDQKAVKAAAETFRPNPDLDTAQVITELGTGEALVSFLEGKGTPSMVMRTLIRPPAARLGPLTPEERKAIIARSPVQGEYDKAEPHKSLAAVLDKHAASSADEASEETGAEPAGKRGELTKAAPSGFWSRFSAGVAGFFNHPAVRQFGRSVAAVVARTATREAMRRMGIGARRSSSRGRTHGLVGSVPEGTTPGAGNMVGLGFLGDVDAFAGERGLFATANRSSKPVRKIALDLKLGPVPDPEPEPVLDLKPGPVPDPEPETVLDLKPGPVPDSEPGPVLDRKPEPVPDPEPEPVLDLKLEPASDPEPEPVRDRKLEPASDPEPEPVLDLKPGPVPDPEPEPVLDLKPGPVPDPEPEPVLDRKPEPVPDPKPEPVPASQPDVITRSTADPERAPALEPQSASEPTPQPEPIPKPKPARRPASKKKTARAPEVPSALEPPAKPGAEPESATQPPAESGAAPEAAPKPKKPRKSKPPGAPAAKRPRKPRSGKVS